MNLNTTVEQTIKAIDEQFSGNPNEQGGWNDLEGNVSSSRKLDGSQLTLISKDIPEGSGVGFPAYKFNIGNVFYQTYQVHHGVVKNSPFHLHMHGFTDVTSAGKKLKFNVKLLFAGVGSKYAWGLGGAAGTDVEIALADDEKYGNFLHNFVETSGLNPTVSSIVKIAVTRVQAAADDLGDNKFFIDFVDAHIKIDEERGSRQEFVK